MSKILYTGFFLFVASTIAFIVSILTPFWIVKSAPAIRGIFEACETGQSLGTSTNTETRTCTYLLLPAEIGSYASLMRFDYAIACASLSIAASSLAIIFTWVIGLNMCIESRFYKLRLTEFIIAGTLLIDALTVVIWVVMLAKNLDANNVITTNQIGWSLWLAVGSTGGFLVALVLFCIHRIDIGASYAKRNTYNESREMSESVTVDSLVQFRYKKKFSFANRSKSGNQCDANGAETTVADVLNNDSNDSNSHGGAFKGSKNSHKGTAILKGTVKKKKHNSSSSSFSPSSSDCGVSSSSSDNDTNSTSTSRSKSQKSGGGGKKSAAKKSSKKAGSDTEEGDDGDANEIKFRKICRLFPTCSTKTIRSVWIESAFNSKKCIDAMVKREANNGSSNDSDNDDARSSNNDATIEEWSDGDESVRARNKQQRLLNEEKKRKVPAKQSVVANPRTILIDSDDDDNEVSNLNAASRMSGGSVASSLNENSNSVSVTSFDDDDRSRDRESKQQQLVRKKSRIESSSDDENESNAACKSASAVISKCKIASSSNESDENEKTKIADDQSDHHHHHSHHSHHKHKKHDKHKKKDKKKKSNKKSKRDDGDNNSGVDDDEYNRGGGDDNSDDSEDNDEETMSEEQKDSILTLFNSAHIDDIQSMLAVTATRLKKVIAMRPFASYKDLKSRLSCHHSLLSLIRSAKEMIYARSIVSSLLSKCEQISQRMTMQVASLVDADDDTKTTNTSRSQMEIKSQPRSLNKALTLKPYQLIGLNWLCLMHKENINGILADEMGLGKTCQTISFLAYLMEESKNKKHLMHLIVVPPSTLDNWIREISVWLPSFYFTVYQGNLDERRHMRYEILNNKFEKPLNAILTTYGMLSSTSEDKAFFRKLTLEYCVFDEAHMLKNMNSVRYQSLIQIKSRKRLLLTGTPLQNNLVELMSLLYFVMPDIFHHKTEYVNKIFASKPSNVDVDTFYKEKIAQAKGIMKPFIMRRLKTEVLKQLPQKTEHVVLCEMSERQASNYKRTVAEFIKRKDALLEQAAAEKEAQLKHKEASKSKNDDDQLELADTIASLGSSAAKKSRNGSSVVDNNSTNNIIMELRKCANHPLLQRTLYTNDKLKQMAKLIMRESPPDTVFDYVVEDMSVMSDFQLHKLCYLYRCLKGFELSDQAILDSGKFAKLDKLLEEKKKKGDRVLLFSQFIIMLDIVEAYLKIRSYKYVRLDGSTAISERQDMIDNYNSDSELFVFMLSTKAGGVGINLTAANVVIMHDIDYNPFNDKQAEDRCHRVGQTKEVQVYKLISAESIDETMLKIQKRKLELGADISEEKDDAQLKDDMVSLLKEALQVR